MCRVALPTQTRLLQESRRQQAFLLRGACLNPAKESHNNDAHLGSASLPHLSRPAVLYSGSLAILVGRTQSYSPDAATDRSALAAAHVRFREAARQTVSHAPRHRRRNDEPVARNLCCFHGW